MTIDNIIEEIDKASNIVILTHESPDGDAVGSALAMYLTLKKLGKTVDFFLPDYNIAIECQGKQHFIEKNPDLVKAIERSMSKW